MLQQIVLTDMVNVSFLMPKLREGAVPEWMMLRTPRTEASRSPHCREELPGNVSAEVLNVLTEQGLKLANVGVRKKTLPGEPERSVFTFSWDQIPERSCISDDQRSIAMTMLRHLLQRPWNAATLFSKQAGGPVHAIRFKN